MARWRKVDLRMWADARFRSLTPPPPNARDLFIGMLIGPCTTQIPGVVLGTPPELAASMGWGAEGYREAFAVALAEAIAKLFLGADLEAGLIWLPRGPHYNRPQSVNAVVAWRDTWDLVPECNLKEKIWSDLKAFAEGLGEAYAVAFAKACPKPTPIQEQEQEQEQEEASAAPSAAAGHPREFSLEPDSKPKPPKEPLPFKREDALLEVERAAGGRFVVSKPSAAHMMALVPLVRDHADLSLWRLTGEYLAAGNERGLEVLGVGQLIRFFRDLCAKAQAWEDRGRKPVDVQSQAKDPRRGICQDDA
jgi:hypothetical protein